MRNRLNSLLGRSHFKTHKFKPLVNLAISRLAVLKNQRQVRCNQSHSDVVQLLQQGHHERALLRVEQVIKEQNMLDAYVMVEGYCNLLLERVHLIEQERECPDELEEAISGIIYAASRCGDFPELQEIRALFTSRYGKDFAARAVELRNHCRVSHKMIQKLSTRQPNLENRMKVLQEIASENSIVLQLDSSYSTEEILDAHKNENQQMPPNPSTSLGGSKLGDKLHSLSEEIEKGDNFSDSLKSRKKYKDVADAAQAAFESAAYAAAAARAAVELSRLDPHHPDNQDSPGSTQSGNSPYKYVPAETESESENEEILIGNQAGELKKSLPSPSSESASYTLEATRHEDPFDKDLVFDESDNEAENEQKSTPSPHKQIPSSFQAGLKIESGLEHSTAHVAAGSGIQNEPRLNLEKGPFSVRTRRVRGY